MKINYAAIIGPERSSIAQAVDVAMQEKFIPPTPEEEKQALASFTIRELDIAKAKKNMRIVVKPPTFIEKFKAGSKNFHKNLQKAVSRKRKK